MAEGENSQKGFTCGKCYHWTIQILLWGSLIWLIIGSVIQKNMGAEVFVPAIILYVIYWINMCCSATFSYLNNKKTGNGIYDYMGSLFYEPAFVDFHIQCYHNETRTVPYTQDGQTRWRTETHRVNTYSETTTFKYMTWRDVSGPFLLNTAGYRRDPFKAMVKLRVKFDVEFANDGTLADFEAQKDHFIRRNQYRDTHYDFTQTNRLRGYEEYNLINITNEPNPSINICYLLISTLLCVNEFYKIYVDSFCIPQDFKISKLVSSRSNLNLPDIFIPYIDRLPRIVIMDKDITYNDPSRFGQVNVVPDLPSLDEITPNKGINMSYGMNTESQAINVNQGTGNLNQNQNQGINMGYGYAQGENNQNQGINMGYGFDGNNQTK